MEEIKEVEAFEEELEVETEEKKPAYVNSYIGWGLIAAELLIIAIVSTVYYFSLV